MAIGADGGIGVPCGQSFLVNAVECFVELLLMTLLAGGIKLNRKLAWRFGSFFGVRKSGNIGMAIYAGHRFFAVYALLEGIR